MTSRNFIFVFFALVGCFTLIHVYLIVKAEHETDPWEVYQWQKRRKGIAVSSPKVAMEVKGLHYQGILQGGGGIDTLILGSSLAMGILSKGVKPEKAYNYSVNGLPAYSSYLLALEALDKGKNIKNIIITLDWSVVFFNKHKVAQVSFLEREAKKPLKKNKSSPLNFKTRVEEAKKAINFLKFKNTLKKLFYSFVYSFSEHEGLEEGEIVCPESPREFYRDFNSPFPGQCQGIRFGGSATYGFYRFSKSEYLHKLKSVESNSKTKHLIQGSLPPFHREKWVEIQKRVKAKNGALILILPPIAPGFQEKIFQSPVYGPRLKDLKINLFELAKELGVKLIDWTDSGSFGCQYSDFFPDGYHALPDCFNKLFASPSGRKIFPLKN